MWIASLYVIANVCQESCWQSVVRTELVSSLRSLDFARDDKVDRDAPVRVDCETATGAYTRAYLKTVKTPKQRSFFHCDVSCGTISRAALLLRACSLALLADRIFRKGVAQGHTSVPAPLRTAPIRAQ